MKLVRGRHLVSVSNLLLYCGILVMEKKNRLAEVGFVRLSIAPYEVRQGRSVSHS